MNIQTVERVFSVALAIVAICWAVRMISDYLVEGKRRGKREMNCVCKESIFISGCKATINGYQRIWPGGEMILYGKANDETLEVVSIRVSSRGKKACRWSIGQKIDGVLTNVSTHEGCYEKPLKFDMSLGDVVLKNISNNDIYCDYDGRIK